MDLQNITQQLVQIAKDAGAFIRQERRSFSRDDIEYKDVNNLVSYVDKETEKQVVAALRQLVPEAGFITEEGTTGEQADRTGLNWIIDPLDGTTNFIHNLPLYCVSIGLVQGTQSLAGVVYDGTRDECFFAYRGGGAWLSTNGGPAERIRVSTSTDLGDSLIATGFPYFRTDRMQRVLEIMESLLQRSHGLRRLGSAAIDLAYVACGRFEAFYEFNLKSWDMAAGVLLVEEAGGVITDYQGGNDYLFRGDVIAGCAMQPQLLAVIDEYWNKK